MKTKTRNTRARLLTVAAGLILLTAEAGAQDLNNDARIRARMERAMRRDSVAQSAEPTHTSQPTVRQRTATPDTLRAEPGDLNARLLERMERRARRDTTLERPAATDLSTPIILPTEPLTMSDRALYWSRYWRSATGRIPSYFTFNDTIIVNPLFMPVLFKKKNLDNARRIVFYRPMDLNDRPWERPLYRPIHPFERAENRIIIQDYAYRYVRHYHPNYFRHSADDLPVERTLRMRMNGNVQVPVYHVERSANDYDAPPKFIPDRRYWTSSLESSLRFSPNL
ncbi:hypothetical protein T230_10500 [Tannerella sp. oral taxon BU063 isolate Cell 1/3]|uniref:Uncharacterized protein n=1 Tax=Tannerella sp. oral taxon BU063 isolate Cell 1/3 TaxID=1411022 RepID=W2CK29_9BACT|nr:hypothetical protein T230_10500 [Tannerella sp. oral taxon BU063 isolate Cell 1/3]